MADLERSGRNGGGGNGRVEGSVGRIGSAVPPPSRQYRTVQGGQLFTETLALTIESAKKIRNKCTVVVGGLDQLVRAGD